MSTVTFKRLGRRRVTSEPREIDLSSAETLADLIATCVRAEVARYNARQAGDAHLAYLLPADIDRRGRTGRITFGEVAERREADPERAIADALLAHGDGLFAVFVDDVEVRGLSVQLSLKPDSVVAIVRLAFLAGRMF